MKAPKQLLTLMLVASVAACSALRPERQPEDNAEIRLDRGLFALDAGRYAAAFDDLAWVYNHCSGHQAGTRALVALAALELDPRNAAARPPVGSELLGRAIREPGTARWVRPLVETAYLTSLALGAPRPEDAEEAPDPSERTDTAAVDPAADPATDTAAAPPADSAAEEEHGNLIAEALGTPPRATGSVRGCGPAVPTREADVAARPLPELPGPSMAALLAASEARRDSVATTASSLREQLATVTEQLRVTEEELERIRKTLKP